MTGRMECGVFPAAWNEGQSAEHNAASSIGQLPLCILGSLSKAETSTSIFLRIISIMKKLRTYLI